MSADPHRVILTGENPFIRLSDSPDGELSTNASFWRVIFSPGGPGHVLYIKSELTDNKWRIYADNISMARWLQNTVQGMINPDTADTSIPVTEAEFSQFGDMRDGWTERVEAYDEELELTWYEVGDPLLIHTEPGKPADRKYGVCTVLIPATGARLTRNGVEASGQAWPTEREGRPFSSCALAFSESWTEQR